MQSKIEGFRKDRGIDDSDPQSRDALEAEQRRRRGEMRDKRRALRKEERRKAREEPTAKPAKVGLGVLHLSPCGRGARGGRGVEDRSNEPS